MIGNLLEVGLQRRGRTQIPLKLADVWGGLSVCGIYVWGSEGSVGLNEGLRAREKVAMTFLFTSWNQFLASWLCGQRTLFSQLHSKLILDIS